MATSALVRKFDGLGLDFTAIAEDAVLPCLRNETLRLDTAEIEAAAKAIKFSECLPEDLRARVVRARLYC